MLTSKTALVPAAPQAAPAQPTVEPSYALPNLADYSVAGTRINKLKSLASTHAEEAETRRLLRNIDVDVEAKRQNGQLKADEVYTPVRLANQNIEREQGKYVAYLKQPQRAAFFYCEQNPALNTELMALDFTKRFRYTGWELTFFSNVDRFQTHGWGAMEVQYDVNKPGRFYNDDIPFEDLLVPQDFRDIQTCEMVGRIFHKTKSQLMAMVQTHGFVPDQVEKICGDSEEDSAEQTLHQIEKVYFRVNGVVHVAWSCEGKADDWVRTPRPFHNGVVTPQGQPVYENNYPFVVFPYKVSENKRVTELKGRVFYDEYQQEAATSLQSSYCTAHRRASAPYFSSDSDAPGGEEAQNVMITPGVVIPNKIKAFQLAAPDSSMLSAVQALTTQSSQESGNINYAANNRVDSRKTATEIQSASAENELLATTQTALFSTAMTQILELDWRIFSSQCAAGLIQTTVNPQFYTLKYILTPAGDVEVVARMQKLNNMKQTWPVVQTTAIASEFLKRMLMLMFPEDAPVYNSMLMADEQKANLIVSLWNLVQAFAIDPATGNLEAAAAPYLQQLQQLGETIAQVTGTPSPFAQLQPTNEQSNNQNQPAVSSAPQTA